MNALTIDVEDWYHTNGLDMPADTWDRCEDRVVRNTVKVLDLLDEYGVKGTFFVLGCVASHHPELVKDIAGRGHEIGSHGGWHQMLTRMSPEQFREDLLYSKAVLEQVTGKTVTMFRAPSWSITPDNYRVLDILQEEGFTVDSSFQPFETPLSGIKNAPRMPFHPIVNGKRLGLVEFPSTVYSFGPWTVPFSGGFYLRAMPLAFIIKALKAVNAKGPGMIYLHPWEFDPEQPKVDIRLSPMIRLAQYYRLNATERKLRKLLSLFPFCPLGELIHSKNSNYPSVKLS